MSTAISTATTTVRSTVPGPQEWLVIAIVAVLVFGPDRLPELARNAAKLLARVRSETDRSISELKRAAGAEGLDKEWREISDDLRGTRDQLRSTGADVRARFEREAGIKPQSGSMAGRERWRADDDPPPVDAEAT